MSILSKLRESSQVNQAEDIKDYSGSSFISESGVYDYEIKKAFLVESKSGSIGIYIQYGGEVNHEETIYVSNKEGQTYFTRNGKEQSLPAYVQAKKMNYLFTGSFVKSLAEMAVEERIIKHYEWVEDPEDEEKKKKVDKEITAEVLVDWIGKTGKISVQMCEKEKQVKQGDKYVGTGEVSADKDGKPYLEVSILNFFNDDKKTASEMLNEKDATQLDKDIQRIEKAPVRLFKKKGASKPSKASSGASTAPRKPTIF